MLLNFPLFYFNILSICKGSIQATYNLVLNQGHPGWDMTALPLTHNADRTYIVKSFRKIMDKIIKDK